MSYLRYGLVVVFLAIFSWLVYRTIDLHQVTNALITFPVMYTVAILGLSFGILVLKATRFWLLLKQFGVKVDLWESIKVSIAGSAASPLPAGEAFRGVLLYHETGQKMKDTSGAIITQAYFEIAIAVIMMVFVLLVFPDLWGVVLTAIGITVLVTTVLVSRPVVEFLCNHLPQTTFVKKSYKFLIRLHHDFIGLFLDKQTHKPSKILFQVIFLTVVAHIAGGLLMYLLLKALGTEINFFLSIFLYVSSIVITGIGTISPGGLGFTEGGLFGLLVVVGAKKSEAVAAIVIFRSATLLFSILLGILFLVAFYLRYFLSRKRSWL